MPAEASRAYDRIGRLQDTQAFYERAAVAELVRRGAFEESCTVVPQLVGGCRPIELLEHVTADCWEVEKRVDVTSFGVPSEVLVARPR